MFIQFPCTIHIFKCTYFDHLRKKFLPANIQHYAIESNIHKLFELDEENLSSFSHFSKSIISHFKKHRKNKTNYEKVTTRLGRTVMPPTRLNL